MAKGASKSVVEMLECWEALVNTDELEAATEVARRWVLEIQAKLHRWAPDDPRRRFDDLFNLVTDPAFLLLAWDRVRHNKGAKTAGVDGRSAHYVQAVVGVEVFLDELRTSLKDRSFRPLPVRERLIPKANGKTRRLGIATVRDRVVQASLKLVLEPILEAGFLPCSYGFRPGRRAHDAIAETRYLATRSYEWVVEGWRGREPYATLTVGWELGGVLAVDVLGATGGVSRVGAAAGSPRWGGVVRRLGAQAPAGPSRVALAGRPAGTGRLADRHGVG